MATVREGNPYQGGGMGAGGKFRKRPFRRNQTTPYDHPPSALRNPSANRNYGWFSKPVDPAQTLITTGAHMLFSSVFRKRLPAPPPSISTSPPNPLLSEAEQEVRENEQEAAAIDTLSCTLGSFNFGSSSATAGATGNSIFGLSSPAMTTVNSQSHSSLFGLSTSLLGGHGSATSGFATSQSQSIPFGSSASSSSFGLSGNTSFSSGSSISPSSSVTDAFSSGFSTGLSTSSSPSTANVGRSISGATSSLFGASSWQADNSSFSSTFTFNSSSSSGFSLGALSASVSLSSSLSSGFSFGASSGSVSSTSSSSGFSFGASGGSVLSTSSWPMFGSSTASIAPTASTPMFGSFTSVASTTSTPMFGGSSLSASSSPIFSFTSAGMATSIQPVFGNPNPVFSFGSAANNDQMSMEDSMTEDQIQSASPLTPATPAFGQQPALPQSNFIFGALPPSGASPFQFGTQQNIAPQSSSPFQASGSLEFNGAGSFSLGAGNGDKSGRKYVKINKNRRLPQSNFVFVAPPPSGASPFQFGTQQNIAPQSSSPFQASGSLEFNGAGSFSLGAGGGDKSGRKYVKINKNRRLPQSNFVFVAPPPSGASPFQFGTQQNIAPQSSSPFQASSSLEFNGAGSFSLGAGGRDKSGRKYVKINKNRRLPQSNFVFVAPPPSGASPFQFGTQQNIAPQSSSPFQASGSLEFNGAGSSR
ncbi:hypothetical protein QN277_000902 [Acacia crassicarpa]|uniref:Nuclear pore complex protein n=1 Tax=Acacia crassicarpa TaxID=499986 RepID=A0AAE1N8N0_9FABA|nr:hypothetical protein QN277_000902 [Acacia crassicarpa]